MNKIYLYCVALHTGSGRVNGSSVGGDVIGYALAEDGKCLASHLSSDEWYSKHDMGLTSDWKHKLYAEHYPEGYTLEWIKEKDLDNHEGFKEAFALNKKLEAEIDQQ